MRLCTYLDVSVFSPDSFPLEVNNVGALALPLGDHQRGGGDVGPGLLPGLLQLDGLHSEASVHAQRGQHFGEGEVHGSVRI